MTADLEAVVRALHDGAPGQPRPPVYRRLWTEQLQALDQTLLAWAESVRTEHNQDCDQRAQQACGKGSRHGGLVADVTGQPTRWAVVAGSID